MKSILLVCAMLPACAAPDYDTTTFDPSAVQNGQYKLTFSTQSDNCSPAREMASTTDAVYTTPDSIDAFTYARDFSGSAVQRYELDATDGYEQRPAPGERLKACPALPDDQAGSLVYVLTLTAADASSFDVDFDQTWQIVAACPNTLDNGQPLPTSSCHASLTLHYQRVGS